MKGPNRHCLFVSPTFGQIKDPSDGAFATLSRIIPKSALKKIHKVDFLFRFKNGSTISVRCGHANNKDGLRGGGTSALVVDEYRMIDPSVWNQILAPRLADTEGRALFLSTPAGYDHVHTMFEDAKNLDDWEAFQFTTLDGGRVSKEEVERQRSYMTEREFDQEFLASFTNLSNRVYDYFGVHNLSDKAVDDGVSDLLVGMDFNVHPWGNSVVVCRSQQHEDSTNVIYVLKAFSDKQPVPKTAARLKAMYPGRKITVYPDPAGKMASATGITTYQQLKDAGFRVHAPRNLPKGLSYLPIVDKVNNTQANLMSGAGVVRLLINERECGPLIKSLNGHTYDKNGFPTKNKAGGLEHFSDSLGVLLWSINNLHRSKPQSFALKDLY